MRHYEALPRFLVAGIFTITLLLLSCKEKKKSVTSQALQVSSNTSIQSALPVEVSPEVSTVDLAREDSISRETLNAMSNNGETNFTDSTLTLSILRQLLLDDSVLNCALLGEYRFNDEPMVKNYREPLGESDVELYVFSIHFLNYLLSKSDDAQFVNLVRSVKYIKGAEHDMRTTLGALIYSRELCRKTPELHKALMDARRETRIPEPSEIERDLIQSQSQSAMQIINNLRMINQNIGEKITRSMFPLIYWAECELDSVADLTEELVTRVASIVDPSLLETTKDSTITTASVAVPMYFTLRSFVDPEVDLPSILDCREQLLEHYLNDVVCAMMHDTCVVNDPHLADNLTRLNSDFFNASLTYFALAIQGNSAAWKKVDLVPSLQFTSQEYCSSDRVLNVNLFISCKSASSVLLVAALPTDEYVKKGRIPAGYFPAKIIREDSVTMKQAMYPNENDTVLTEYIRVFAVPDAEKKIRQLLRVDGLGTSQGVLSVNLYSRLSAVMHSGDTVEVISDGVFGHHSPESARVGDPIIADVNGDHLFDIIIDASRARQLLFLQLDGGGFEMRTLIAPDHTGGAGC